MNRYAASLARSALTPSPPDDRDYRYIPLGGNLPGSVDLRSFTGRVENQLSIGACFPNAVVSGCEMMKERALGGIQGVQRTTDLSRMFLYYTAREIMGTIGQEGTDGRSGMKAAHRHGICDEATWPYDLSRENARPSVIAYGDALTKLVERYELIYHWSDGRPDNIIPAIQSALVEGLPVIYCFGVGEKIFNVQGPLTAQRYQPVGAANPFAGNHAVLACGYRDEAPNLPYGVIFENSWDADWGDNGYGLLPWSVIANDTLEVWVIRGFSGNKVVPPPGITLREITRRSVTVRVVPTEPVNTNIWVGAEMSNGWQLKTPYGWVPLNGKFPAMLRGIEIEDELDIAVVSPEDNLDLAQYTGTKVYVAYGETPFNWTLQEVATIPQFPGSA